MAAFMSAHGDANHMRRPTQQIVDTAVLSIDDMETRQNRERPDANEDGFIKVTTIEEAFTVALDAMLFRNKHNNTGRTEDSRNRTLVLPGQCGYSALDFWNEHNFVGCANWQIIPDIATPEIPVGFSYYGRKEIMQTVNIRLEVGDVVTWVPMLDNDIERFRKTHGNTSHMAPGLYPLNKHQNLLNGVGGDADARATAEFVQARMGEAVYDATPAIWMNIRAIGTVEKNTEPSQLAVVMLKGHFGIA